MEIELRSFVSVEEFVVAVLFGLILKWEFCKYEFLTFLRLNSSGFERIFLYVKHLVKNLIIYEYEK